MGSFLCALCVSVVPFSSSSSTASPTATCGAATKLALPRTPRAFSTAAPGRCRQAQRFRVGWFWFLAAYLAVAAAVLLKGPIGAILPGAVVIVHLAAPGELSRRRTTGHSFLSCALRRAHELGLWWGVPLVIG